MNADSHSVVRDPADRSTAETVSGYLASLAIAVSFLGVFWNPLRLIIPALAIALVAAGMHKGRLQLAAVLIGSFCFFLGFSIAVSASHPLW